MNKAKTEWLVWGIRVASVGLLTWVATYIGGMVTKDQFDEYKRTQKDYISQGFRGLEGDINDVKDTMARIENRLDRRGAVGYNPQTNNPLQMMGLVNGSNFLRILKSELYGRSNPNYN